MYLHVGIAQKRALDTCSFSYRCLWDRAWYLGAMIRTVVIISAQQVPLTTEISLQPLSFVMLYHQQILSE